MNFPTINPKTLTAALIAALIVQSAWSKGITADVWPQVIAAVFVIVSVDVLMARIQRRPIVAPVSGVITGLIIGGVLAPGSSALLAAAIALLAAVSKYAVRLENQNVFNPAAFGLFFGTWLMGAQLSWWVDSWHALTIVAGALLFAYMQGRWRLAFAFLVPYFSLIVLRAIIAGHRVTLELFLSFSISTFFVFFMLTDPRTMPLVPKRLPLFALIVAAISFASVLWFPKVIFIGALLIGNAVAAAWNWKALHPEAKLARVIW